MPKKSKQSPPKKTSGPKKKAFKAAKSGASKAGSKGTSGCPKAALKLYAAKYASLVNGSGGKLLWSKIGTRLSRAKRKEIRNYARANNLIPKIPINAGGFPDFTGYIKVDTTLPKSLFGSTDAQQFSHLDSELAKSDPSYDKKTRSFPPSKKKYTWHHHQDSGRMQLVEMGIHDATNHNGGRTTWATGPRK